MLKVNESEIVEILLVCPYCMSQVSYGKTGCCGESSGHFQNAYELSNGELYLDHEVVIASTSNKAACTCLYDGLTHKPYCIINSPSNLKKI